MSNQRKLRRVSKKEPPVLIVRPHKMGGETCQATSLFILRNQLMGIAVSKHFESKAPELARNAAIDSFLHDMTFKNQTHIFFLDDDSTPDDNAIIRLLRHNKSFVAAVTPIIRYKELNGVKTDIDCHWNAIMQIDGELCNIGIDELPKELFKAYRVGGTGLLIKREVFQKLKPPYQKTTYNENYTGVKLSEDMYFSDKIRDAGFDLWVDPNIWCSHFHNTDLRDIFNMLIQAKQMGYEKAKQEIKAAI